MIRAYLCLGSNLGNRRALIDAARELLEREGVGILRASRVYETMPVEVQDRQEPYLNMVLEVVFDGDPLGLLERCQGVENSLGRKRPYRHAPRTMDIDILLVEGVTMDHDLLKVPHPGLEQRAFAVYPLADVSPGLILPSGRTAAEVKNLLKGDEEVRVWGI
ncbi:MAG TPA: 2-amino-4-hydroxy-6-hydroxymethyldihydropteridine diphosphokinase [Deltaproteobacteria bacterium]|nr:2-amino-4-hydroxy-6-hydroxymethyldihydropteridine diphosphokinase [Deltaproteobacteria bacterium]HQI82306.1 2-amino-4-hydroxy-6-hydroxymethyldihydropteridine diphosphokinase [Deltaproteobacteria bacterium]